MASTTKSLARESLARESWAAIEEIYDAVLRHPFITGLTDGTLGEDVFRYYIVQDTLYLREYARVFSVAAGRAESDADMLQFLDIATELLHAEQSAHQEFFDAWGLSHDDVWSTGLAPTNLAYATYMLNVAHSGTFADSVGAVLPCAWIYLEVGKTLARKGSPNAIFQKWIDTYAGEEYEAQIDKLLALTDRLAVDLSPKERERFVRHFVIGAKYEWMFWDMGYRKEAWPV